MINCIYTDPNEETHLHPGPRPRKPGRGFGEIANTGSVILLSRLEVGCHDNWKLCALDLYESSHPSNLVCTSNGVRKTPRVVVWGAKTRKHGI